MTSAHIRVAPGRWSRRSIGQTTFSIALIALAVAASGSLTSGKVRDAGLILGAAAALVFLLSRRLIVSLQWLVMIGAACVSIFSPWSGHGASALAQYLLVAAAVVGVMHGAPSTRASLPLAAASAALAATVVLTTHLSSGTVQEAIRTYLLVPLIAFGFRPTLAATGAGRGWRWLFICRLLATMALVWMLTLYLAPTGSSLSEVQGHVQPYRGVRLHFNDVTYLLAAYPLVELWAGLTRHRVSVAGLALSAGAVAEVVISQLRTAWLLLLIGCAYAILRQRRVAVRLLATGIAATAVVGLYTASSLVRTRTQEVVNASDPSRAFRQEELTQIDLPAIKQNPAGYGVGSVARNGGLTSAGDYRFPGAHSSLIVSTLEVGVVGTLAFLAIAITPVFRERRNDEAFPLDGCLAASLVGTFVISPTLLTLPVNVVLGLCVGRTVVTAEPRD